MTRTALVEYFVLDDRVLLLILTPASPVPQVFTLRADLGGEPLGAQTLADRALRLSVDVNGLPPRWSREPRTKARYARALQVPPEANASWRAAPVLQRKLDNPHLRYSFDYLEELGPHLLPPAARHVLDGCDLLCFVPHGPLHALPFALLRWTDDQLLGDVFGVCQVPSASLVPLLGLRRTRGSGTGRRALVIGCDAAEDLDDEDSLERGATDIAKLLDGRGVEVTDLVGMAAGREPTPDAIGRLVAGKSIVHIACHGAFTEGESADPMANCGVLVAHDGRRPSRGTSGALRAGLLSGRDVLGMTMTADLVTLQSCSAGRASTAPGDEQLGLVRALLYAGACSLVVGLWDVNRTSSQLLLRRFYELWMDGMAKWRALRAAQGELRGGDRYGHPFHWAGFVLVGDGK